MIDFYRFNGLGSLHSFYIYRLTGTIFSNPRCGLTSRKRPFLVLDHQGVGPFTRDPEDVILLKSEAYVICSC